MDKLSKIVSTIKPSSKFKAAYKQGLQVYANATILALEGQREVALPYVKKELKKAIKLHFNNLAAEFSAYLHYHYCVFAPNKLSAHRYLDLHLKYVQLAKAEKEVQIIFSSISLQLNTVRTISEKNLNDLNKTCKKLQPYLKYQSAPIHIFIYTLFIAQAYLQKQYAEVIHLCQKIISFLEEQGIDKTTTFYYNLTPALIVQKQYPEAQVAIQKAIRQANKGSYSWSVYTYYQFVLEIHRQDYARAYTIFKTAEQKRHINRAMHEQWLIVRGYVQFLMRAGKIPGRGHFKLGKFLNEVPVFSADKAGNNINIIILSILHNLGKNHDQIIDRKEALEKYMERYVPRNSRAWFFLKLLLKVPHYRFDKPTIIRKGAKQWEQLKAISLEVDNADIEIVPFEHLWEMVLGMLKREKR